MADDLSDLAARLNRMADGLSGPMMRKVMTGLGVAAKKDVEQAVRGDLGDVSMSNWTRGRPIQIVARFDEESDTAISVTPVKSARGPVRVLESGRRAGISRARRGRRPRRVSASRGRGTWTTAERLIEERSPERAERAIFDELRGSLGA